MNLREITGALLMPNEALQAGPNGNFVYVAKPDGTVEVRRVKTLPADRSRLIVENGLNPGDKVVTDGSCARPRAPSTRPANPARAVAWTKAALRPPRWPAMPPKSDAAPKSDAK